MEDAFKLYSETNPEAKKYLNPDLNLRNWDDLTQEEKITIFHHLNIKKWLTKDDKIVSCIYILNDLYKYHSPGKNLLSHGGPHLEKERSRIRVWNLDYFKGCCIEMAFSDLIEIFFHGNKNFMLECFSVYSILLLSNSYPHTFDLLNAVRKQTNINISRFDSFKNDLNEIFEQFCNNVSLTAQGFIPRQENKIIKEIYEPVLNILSDPKWEFVNRDLSDAFKEYLKNEVGCYSHCITHSVSAFQAYLQIIVYGKTGKGEIKELIDYALAEGLIPNDTFSKKILKEIPETLMEYRQKYGDPHPKQEYANEKNAKLVLNLIMIFLQHALQK